MVEENPYAFGSCIAFEPYSFYKDSLYYAPYLYERPEGSVTNTWGEKTTTILKRTGTGFLRRQVNRDGLNPTMTKGEGIRLCAPTPSRSFQKDKSGKEVFHGVITIDISLTELAKIVTSVKLYKTGYRFLLSREGKIIASPDPKLIFKDIRETKRGEEEVKLIQSSG